jgi:hypothetical protein
VRRIHLEHRLRAASTISGERDVLVIGSQSVLAVLAEDALPDEATASIEADVAFFDDPDDAKADQVDGAIGELSPFHERHGYYAQACRSLRRSSRPDGATDWFRSRRPGPPRAAGCAWSPTTASSPNCWPAGTRIFDSLRRSCVPT